MFRSWFICLCFVSWQDKLRDAEKTAKELQESFAAEEAKSVEMAAELLTLVNQKIHLEAVGVLRAGTSHLPIRRFLCHFRHTRIRYLLSSLEKSKLRLT